MGNLQTKRQLNERKLGNWDTLPNGGRKYWYEVDGHVNWKARYVKEVDERELTLRFSQEIYNSEGKLVEVHQKYPADLGHRKKGEVESK